MQEFKAWVSVVFTLIKRPELLKNKDFNPLEAIQYFEKISEDNLTLLGLDKKQVLDILQAI